MSTVPAPANNDASDLLARNLFYITVASALAFSGVVLVFVLL